MCNSHLSTHKWTDVLAKLIFFKRRTEEPEHGYFHPKYYCFTIYVIQNHWFLRQLLVNHIIYCAQCKGGGKNTGILKLLLFILKCKNWLNMVYILQSILCIKLGCSYFVTIQKFYAETYIQWLNHLFGTTLGSIWPIQFKNTLNWLVYLRKA